MVWVTRFAWGNPSIGVYHVTNRCPRLFRSIRIRRVPVEAAEQRHLEECGWCGSRQCQHERRLRPAMWEREAMRA